MSTLNKRDGRVLTATRGVEARSGRRGGGRDNALFLRAQEEALKVARVLPSWVRR